jgi:hypothetical protein
MVSVLSANTNERQRTSTKGETRFNPIGPEIVEGMQKRRFEKSKTNFQLPGVPAGDYVLVRFERRMESSIADSKSAKCAILYLRLAIHQYGE